MCYFTTQQQLEKKLQYDIQLCKYEQQTINEDLHRVREKISADKKKFQTNLNMIGVANQLAANIVTTAEAIYNHDNYVIVSYSRLNHDIKMILNEIQKYELDKIIVKNFGDIKIWISEVSHSLTYGMSREDLMKLNSSIYTGARATIIIGMAAKEVNLYYTCAWALPEWFLPTEVYVLRNLVLTDIAALVYLRAERLFKKIACQNTRKNAFLKFRDRAQEGMLDENEMIAMCVGMLMSTDVTDFSPTQVFCERLKKHDISENWEYEGKAGPCRIDASILIDSRVDDIRKERRYLPNSLPNKSNKYIFTTMFETTGAKTAKVLHNCYVNKGTKKATVLLAIAENDDVWVMDIDLYNSSNEKGPNAHIAKIYKDNINKKELAGKVDQIQEGEQLTIQEQIIRLGYNNYVVESNEHMKLARLLYTQDQVEAKLLTGDNTDNEYEYYNEHIEICNTRNIIGSQ